MNRREVMRKHFAEVLMSLCEEQKLEDITVAKVLERAQTARQTFYNYFSDINDLICYTGSIPLVSQRGPFINIESTRNVYLECVAHKAFFRQLPAQCGQNTFRQATIDWLIATYEERYLTPEMTPEERAYHQACIRLYCVGSVEVFLDWCAKDMTAPVDAMVRVLYDMSPAFVKESLALMPEHMEEYPR